MSTTAASRHENIEDHERIARQYRTRSGPWDDALEWRIAFQLGQLRYYPHLPGWSWEDVELALRLTDSPAGDAGRLGSCEACGRPSWYVHLLPTLDRCDQVAITCGDHDPGGFAIFIPDLGMSPSELLNYLAQEAPATLDYFLRWLRGRGRS
jgi:hypothetical protein